MPLPSYLQVDYKSSKLLPLRYLARKAIIFSKNDLQFEMNQISQTALHYQTLKTVIINVRSLPRLSVARGGLRNVNNYKRLYRGIFPWLECLYFRTQKLVKTFAKTCSQKLSMDRPHYSHYSYFIAKLFPGFFIFFLLNSSKLRSKSYMHFVRALPTYLVTQNIEEFPSRPLHSGKMRFLCNELALARDYDKIDVPGVVCFSHTQKKLSVEGSQRKVAVTALDYLHQCD